MTTRRRGVRHRARRYATALGAVTVVAIIAVLVMGLEQRGRRRGGEEGAGPRTSMTTTEAANLPVSDSVSAPSTTNVRATRALFFGDSLIAGAGTTPGSPNMSTRTRDALGWFAEIEGFGGTGWSGGGSLPGGEDYGERLENLDWSQPFDVIVLAGGTNDLRVESDRLQALVSSGVRFVRQKQPDATIVLIGPYQPFEREPPPDAVRTRDAIAAAAAADTVTFVDLLPWTTAGDAATMLSPDGFHPNASGYAYLAERLADALRPLAPRST